MLVTIITNKKYTWQYILYNQKLLYFITTVIFDIYKLTFLKMFIKFCY